MAIGEKRILTVSQLNMYVKSLLESSIYLRDITLVGEISNFTNHYKSGHFYLSLKDDMGVIKAVMFRQYASKIGFTPENGMKVTCRGRVSLYERDGQYQFYISEMQKQGMGELSVEFERLKEKLKNEGLFDEDKKRPISRMPKSIAVITSPTGAAVQDIFNIITRRYPVVNIVMCPVQVQGDLAVPQMIDAIKRVNNAGCADTIIIGRGGGSIEDLWAFNSEYLAREVRNSKIPVISAVGHETDFTICDFAADLRAPTPSGAAELAVPDKNEIMSSLEGTKYLLHKSLENLYTKRKLQLEAIICKPCIANQQYMLEQRQQTLDSVQSRCLAAYKNIVHISKQNFLSSAAKIETLGPMNVLKRGYSAVFTDGKPVLSAKKLKSGDEINIKFFDGDKNAVVQ